jgi:hypothetical protein
VNTRLDPASRSAPAPTDLARAGPVFRRRTGKIVAWALFALVGIASVLPGRIVFRTGLPAELEHVLAYAVAGVVFAMVYGRKGAPASLALLNIGAVVFELAQNFAPHRTPRVTDAACSIAGGMIGIMAGLALRWLWSGRWGGWRSRPHGFESK